MGNLWNIEVNDISVFTGGLWLKMPSFQHKKSAHSKTRDMEQSMANIIQKATDYHKSAGNKAHCHFVMSENAGRQNLSMGLLTTIFSTIVGTTIFPTWRTRTKPRSSGCRSPQALRQAE
jgi:hypothetical protein